MLRMPHRWHYATSAAIVTAGDDMDNVIMTLKMGRGWRHHDNADNTTYDDADDTVASAAIMADGNGSIAVLFCDNHDDNVDQTTTC